MTKINGYKAAIVMTHTGEILARDSVEKKIDLHNVGTVFNDISRAAHGASEKIGLKVCMETTLKTPKGLIIPEMLRDRYFCIFT